MYLQPPCVARNGRTTCMEPWATTLPLQSIRWRHAMRGLLCPSFGNGMVPAGRELAAFGLVC